MIAKTIKKVLAILLVGIALSVAALTPSVSAQTYPTEYPNVFNSGSPLWFTCQVEGRGEFVVLIDPNTNPQSFGFDSPKGYNLINNTGENINGRAYKLNNNTGYLVRFPSYYCMQFREAGSNNTYVWQDVYINEITAGTLDFIDYNGTRGNDNVQYDISQQLSVLQIIIAVLILLLIIGTFIWRA